jgi:hypothetical protein
MKKILDHVAYEKAEKRRILNRLPEKEFVTVAPIALQTGEQCKRIEMVISDVKVLALMEALRARPTVEAYDLQQMLERAAQS